MDPCFLYKHSLPPAPIPTRLDQYTQQFTKEASLDGLLSLQVDDSVGTGSDDFLRREEESAVAFPTKGRTFVSGTDCDLNGSDLVRTPAGAYVMHQSN